MWESFLSIWGVRYIDFPDIIALDQGPEFTSTEWLNLAQTAGIKFCPGIESQSAIGATEGYNPYLCRIYNKMRSESPSLSPMMTFSLPVKITNDAAGPSGLVPSLLVVSIIPRLLVGPATLTAYTESMKAAISVQKELVDTIVQQRSETALHRRLPVTADSIMQVSNEVLLFREYPIAKRVGPYVVERFIDVGKFLELTTGDHFMTVSMDKIKKYGTHGNHINPQSEHETNGNRGLQELDKLLETVWPSEIIRGSLKVAIDELVVKVIEPVDSEVNKIISSRRDESK